MNRPQYRFGTLYSEPRKKGPDVWVYRWREANPQGKRQLRKQIIGTMRELRTRADAQRTAEAFRHTYSSLLAETGKDVKVVQELMRHAKVSTKMDLYTHARMENKRIAQRKAVDVLFNRNSQPEAAL